MPEIEETNLPGVGIRHDFVTRNGDRLGVITHRTGRRQLLVYNRNDPDACREDIRLDEEEGHALAELLGGTTVTEHFTRMFQQSLTGLTIEWLTLGSDWASAERTIGGTQLRTRTGVSVIAVIREGGTVPAPEPDFGLSSGDTLVAVGTPEGLRDATEILRAGA